LNTDFTFYLRRHSSYFLYGIKWFLQPRRSVFTARYDLNLPIWFRL